ncbi:DUF488 domain-containing protein [Neobacillus ginsengisoli]|uniref:Uncharacterized protein YeaO (DUF488 family) n=1 Tax=Neobacillus ginsengisoli TaxID=904295 RepID=A0ABT9Y068_9BACI|nr:DUF488 domain-containing protein [Neobacillus ginsengisoli]MDQ0200519.1 uncharacterized protein YeaO (DUF488 family) [Neobacillus ginsengisoli]
MRNIFLKRIYEPYDKTDGIRILIDRLWPRGISKEDAKLAFWLKDIAPSNELRKLFCHKPERFEEFRSNYLTELQSNETQSLAVEEIISLSQTGTVTLLYGAKDPIYNHAQVLQEELRKRLNEKIDR